MQIDAMDNDVGISEARLQRRTGRNPHQFAAVERVPHQYGRGRIRYRQNLLHQTYSVEDVKDVRPELDAVADGAEFRRAFEHAHLSSAARQGERCREPAQSTSDNENGLSPCHGQRLALTNSDYKNPETTTGFPVATSPGPRHGAGIFPGRTLAASVCWPCATAIMLTDFAGMRLPLR